jgi:hypothetical protein
MMAYGFRVEHELLADPPYIPRKLRFTRSYQLDLPENDEMDRAELDQPSVDLAVSRWRTELQQRKTLWQEGEVNAELLTSDFTNRNGLTVPLAFDFRTFLAGWHDGRIRMHCIGTVATLKDLSAEQAFRPPILGFLDVTDSRLRKRDALRALDDISYMLSATNKWPERNAPEITGHFLAGFSSKAVSGKYQPAAARRKRYIATGVLLLAMVLFPLYLYRLAKAKARAQA